MKLFTIINSIIIVYVCTLVLSCNVVDIIPVEITSSPSQSNSIITNQNEIYIQFSKAVNTSSIESISKITLAKRAIPILFVWESKTKVYIRPLVPLKKGLRYMLVSYGTATTENGTSIIMGISVPFFYQEKGAPLQITSVVDSNDEILSTESIVNVEKQITFNFSEDIDRGSFFNSLSITPATEFTLQWINELKVTITPRTQWDSATQYTLTINDTLTALSGHYLLESYTYQFLTLEDVSFPTVDSISRANFSYSTNTVVSIPSTSFEGILYSESLLFAFSKPLDTSTISSSFSISPSIDGTFFAHSTDQVVFVLAKGTGWDINTEYQVVITNSLKDSSGNNMRDEYSTSFTSGLNYITIDEIKLGDSIANLTAITNINSNELIKIIPDSVKDNNSYWVSITFSQSYNIDYRPIIENLISLQVVANLVTSPILEQIDWVNEDNIRLKYNNITTPVSNSEAYIKYIYELTISSGTQTRNQTGAYIQEDTVVYMYTSL